MDVSLTVQLITVSIITLQRQLSHNLLVSLNEWNSEYDFVVVGGGTAGCVLSARLTENPNHSVLLIDAGGPETVITDMPGLGAATMINPDNLWGYTTTPQTRVAQAFRNPVIPVGISRLLGGTSVTSGMMYGRGNRRLYDRWVTQYGANGWSYDELLPYFIRSENNSDPEILRQNPGYHGTSGPLAVTTASRVDPLYYQFMDLCSRLGYPGVDLNGANQLGAMIIQSMVGLNGVRSTSANVYLQPIFNSRHNLHIIGHSLVTKVLTRRTADNRVEAYGVSFIRDGRNYTVNVRREVIVSAGALKTPQLLMLSGIGPAYHLRQFGIPVVADLPVGDNLMDHLNTVEPFTAVSESQLITHTEPDVRMLYEYYTLGSGQLANYPLIYVYLNSALNDEPDIPDGCLVLLNGAYAPFTLLDPNQTLATLVPQNTPAWLDYYGQLAPIANRVLAYGALLYRPRSRGTVRLASSDPTAMPLIDPNYFGDPRDLAAHVGVYSRLYAISETPEFRRLISLPPSLPGCRACGRSVPLSRCYSYIACVLQSIPFSDGHYSGTCRMGSATDPRAVVDERLRVRGVSRLRVIDASVFPEIPNTNTVAPVIVAAEKGSDMIREDNSHG